MHPHVIVHQFDPSRHVVGGIDTFIPELVKFAPEEHELRLVGVDRPKSRRTLGRWETVDLAGRRIRFMPVARLEAGDQRRRIPHSATLVAGLLRYRPDLRGCVIHAHRVEIGAALSVLYPRASHVQFIHGDGITALRYKTETFWRFLPAGYVALERFAVGRADRTIVMSGTGVDRLRRSSSVVILGKNWFDPTVFFCSNHGSNGVFTIGWAGRLEPPKDPLKAVATFAALRERGFAFKAWIAGIGTLEEAVRRAVRERGLGDQVELLGPLQPAELADRLRRSHTLLMTSLFEGIPRAAVEALACGIPVVSTDVGEIRRLVSNARTGFIAREGSATALADLVLSVETLVHGPEIARTVAHLDARTVVSELFADVSSGHPASEAAR